MHTKAASFSQIMGLILVIFLSTGWILYQGADNLEQRSIKNRALALAAQHSTLRQSTEWKVLSTEKDRLASELRTQSSELKKEIRKAQETSVQAVLDAKEAKQKAGVSLDKSAKVNARIRRYEERVYPYRRFE